MAPVEPRQRIDKWLWFARLTKSRTQAQSVVVSGAVRINRQKIDNASHAVRAGDTLTVALAAGVRVLRVVSTGVRRGPAAEARLLYEDLAPPVAQTTPEDTAAPTYGARPDKRERRQIVAMKRAADEAD
jgi:ribosome-associated heat shock protein Hsp15